MVDRQVPPGEHPTAGDPPPHAASLPVCRTLTRDALPLVAPATEESHGLLRVLLHATPVVEDLACQEASASVASQASKTGRVERRQEEDHRLRLVLRNAAPPKIQPTEVVAPWRIAPIARPAVVARRTHQIRVLAELEQDARAVACLRVVPFTLRDASSGIAVSARMLLDLPRRRPCVGVRR